MSRLDLRFILVDHGHLILSAEVKYAINTFYLEVDT